MSDHICSEIKHLIVSRPLSKFLVKIKRNEKLAEKCENAEAKKEIEGKIFIIFLEIQEKMKNENLNILSRVCKILNLVQPQYFYFLTTNFTIERKKNLTVNVAAEVLQNNREDWIKSYSIKDLIEIYIFKCKKYSPKKIKNLLLTYYKINFESYTKLEKNNYQN